MSDELEECSDTLHSMVMHCLELNRRRGSWITDLLAALKGVRPEQRFGLAFESFISWD